MQHAAAGVESNLRLTDPFQFYMLSSGCGDRMPFDQLKRREFITLLGGAAAWPLAARAQQSERMRRIGVLVAATAGDPEYEPRMAAFRQGLALSGWTDGRNVQIDTR